MVEASEPYITINTPIENSSSSIRLEGGQRPMSPDLQQSSPGIL